MSACGWLECLVKAEVSVGWRVEVRGKGYGLGWLEGVLGLLLWWIGRDIGG